MRPLLKSLAPVALVALAACSGDAPHSATPSGPPPPAPPELALLVGEYSDGADTLSVLEDGGALWVHPWRPGAAGLDARVELGRGVEFLTGDGGVPTLAADGRSWVRLALGPEDGSTFRITPLRPLSELLASAMAATPPEEEGDFLESDLVELTELDPTIRLDIRYAGTDNFMGEVFYSQPRAFLQRPAAEALLRAHQWLAQRGYGLLVYDGYRPWYVTHMFWEATPEELRGFVADPARGSRHNRGGAVDLTLYELATGAVVEMPSGYDEFTPRASPEYPGGSSRQRWHRELLREAMEAQGFEVYPGEWWHFDHADWRLYRLGNQRFEELR